MKSTYVSSPRSWIFGVMLCLVGTGCGNSTKTGNPEVRIEMGPYNSASAVAVLASALTPTGALATVDAVSLCFKRLRFKTDDNDDSGAEDSEDNMDFNVGLITLNPNGTSLGTINVPAGIYRRLEFDLESHCSTQKSVLFTLGSNTYSTEDGVTIKFEGERTIDDATETISLGVQAIITALGTVTSNDNIKDRLEEASADF